MQTSSDRSNPPAANATRADFAFVAAGCNVVASFSDPEPRHLFEHLLGGMAADDFDSPDLRLDWSVDSCHTSPGGRWIKTHTQQAIPSLTLILLLERLRAIRPRMLLLHGNGLIDRETSRPILLLGDSGTGKSTLSRELLASPRFSLLAEDTLIIDLDDGLLHPFPRAASLRVPLGSQPDAPRWRGLGNQREDKILVPTDRLHLSPASPTNALVFCMDGPVPKGPSNQHDPPQKVERLWISHADEELVEKIKSKFAHVQISPPSSSDMFPVLTIPCDGGVNRQMLIDLLASHGAMVLASRVGQSISKSTGTHRPPQPLVAPLAPMDGLRAILCHEVRFAVPDIEARDCSRTIMELAGALAHAILLQLAPGGSPADTAARMLTELDGRN